MALTTRPVERGTELTWQYRGAEMENCLCETCLKSKRPKSRAALLDDEGLLAAEVVPLSRARLHLTDRRPSLASVPVWPRRSAGV
jgi:hypothetical protein